MIVDRIWYSIDQALPPLDKDIGDNDCNCSVIVALALKSGDLAKGFRYYESGPSCWAILDEKDTKLSDDEIVGWSLLPIFEGGT